ncbi:MAG: MltA domain-containing protein [Burkholderiaceae bacterium]|nr:MltA domain-containing protein [Burkholderiaceae bacterium]MDH3461409.1 MltA domain-containing protein [Burkholderiaceae bacterium]
MFTVLRYTSLVLVIVGMLAGCASRPKPVPAPITPPAAVVAPARSDLTAVHSRWVPVEWSELPGWGQDRLSELWPALLRSCSRPLPSWVALCSEAARSSDTSDDTLRAWLEQHVQPYRVESPEGDPDGMITGYYEPLFDASRQPQGAFRSPLFARPVGLESRKPYWTREQIDTLPEAQAQLRGREIAYLADPLETLLLQIQGSGRLRLLDAGGDAQVVRVAFAGHNDHTYKSIGRWLVEQGELNPEQASWPAIKAWARMNPDQVDTMLWSNPRVVFFREEALPDRELGPRGAQGVALTPGRSIAVDPQSIPLGAPVWLDTTEPISNTPLRRLTVAQDNGAAIVGAVRADYFWGWGETAEQQAGRMKQPLRMWVLWPRGALGLDD